MFKGQQLNFLLTSVILYLQTERKTIRSKENKTLDLLIQHFDVNLIYATQNYF